MPINKKGKDSANWKGGIKRTGQYLYVYSPNHPNKTKQGYVTQHRLVMEKHLGRYLTKEEQIHHINENKKDNRLKNLYLCDTNSVHSKLHSLAYTFIVQLNKTNKFLKWFQQERIDNEKFTKSISHR